MVNVIVSAARSAAKKVNPRGDAPKSPIGRGKNVPKPSWAILYRHRLRPRESPPDYPTTSGILFWAYSDPQGRFSSTWRKDPRASKKRGHC